MGLKGRGKVLAKELVELAIKKGHVNGNKIEFRLKDLGEDFKKKGMKFCMRTSRRLFGVYKDSNRVNVYTIDYEVVKCLNDKELEELFKKKLGLR